MNRPEHVYETVVEWVDTDAGGRIHFTAPFRWAEKAEHALRREYGIIAGEGKYGALPRRRVEAEFLKVLRFGDAITVRLWPERAGRTSITWAWTVTKDGEVYVEGKLVVVYVDDDGRPLPLPDEDRAALGSGGGTIKVFQPKPRE